LTDKFAVEVQFQSWTLAAFEKSTRGGFVQSSEQTTESQSVSESGISVLADQLKRLG